MKYLVIVLIFLSTQSFAQITGNPHVKDSSAIKLDAAATKALLGKWKLLRSVDISEKHQDSKLRGNLVEFEADGVVTLSWCAACHEEKAGRWAVEREQVLAIEGNQPQNKYLAGKWVVYSLSETDMVLAKVLTSSGNWKKLHYFSRNIENPPLSEKGQYCLNCTDDGQWCWGDRPEYTQQQWAIVNDLLNRQENKQQYAAEIEESFHWLINNAPCVNKALYILATDFYENRLLAEQQQEKKKAYQNMLRQLKAQQLVYYKE